MRWPGSRRSGGWENTTGLDGKPCALLLLSRLTDADPKATAKALKDRPAKLTKRLPDGMEIKAVDES